MIRLFILSVMLLAFFKGNGQSVYGENFTKAYEYMESENYGVALRFFSDAEADLLYEGQLGEMPYGIVHAYIGKAMAQFHLKRYQEAIKTYNLALKYANDRNIKYKYEAELHNKRSVIGLIYLNRGGTQRMAGNFSLACQDLEKAASMGHKEAAYVEMEIAMCPY